MGTLLSTPAGKAFRPADDRGIYVFWIARSGPRPWAASCPICRATWRKRRPPFVFHLHGLVYFAWLVPVSLEILLVEVNRPALHRRLGWWLNYFRANATMLLAMMAWDVWRHKRVHPALVGGGLLIAAGEGAAVLLEFSPWWHVAAGNLVAAWGWTG